MRELPHARTYVTTPDPLAHIVIRRAADWVAEQEAESGPTVVGLDISYAPEMHGGGGYSVSVTLEP